MVNYNPNDNCMHPTVINCNTDVPYDSWVIDSWQIVVAFY